jgi:ABC-2 type transport system ATP-binding protein
MMNNASSIIDVRHLCKSFGNKTAVIDFNLEVKQGEICGFLGPNGSGKTTTLRMLCGLLTPDSGSGHCLGFDILKQSYEIKKQIGYMTQSFSLYHDLTAYENLDLIARVYGIKNRKKTVEKYLKEFGLVERKNQLAGEMSGGWRQRLALAGCILHDPKLLLLDEPTAGVDPKARRDFWDNIFLLSEQGITTLVSTHYMDEAERCGKLVYIAYGHLLAEGSIEEIIEKSKLITWSVTGNNLMVLSQELKKLAGVDQVGFFGNKLHVSGKSEEALNQAVSVFKDYQWQKIHAGLEDVFISLVENSGESP